MILLRICFCLISVLAETIHDFDFSGLYRYRPISSYSAFFLVHSSEEHPYNISNANDIIYFNFRHGFVRSGYEKCESEQCLLHVVNINGSCKCFGRADLEEYNFYPTGNGIEFNCLIFSYLLIFVHISFLSVQDTFLGDTDRHFTLQLLCDVNTHQNMRYSNEFTPFLSI